jgi:hypothetical protein
VLSFTPDAGGAVTTLTLGPNYTGSTQTSVSVTKPVVSMELCNTRPITGFRFHHADGTNTTYDYSTCNAGTSSRVANLCGNNFIGLLCSWNVLNNGVTSLNGCGPIFDRVQTFAFLQMSNIVYTLGTPAVTTAAYDTNVSNCSTINFLPVKYKNSAGGTIGKPAWLTYTSANKNFTISSSTTADAAIFTVILEAATDLMVPTSWATIPNVTTEFTIQIINPCPNTTINTRTLTSMTVLVSQSTTQNVWFDDSYSFGVSVPALCGTRSYSMAPSYNFISIAANNNSSTLMLSTNAVSDVRTYNIEITVGLANYTGVPKIIVPLNVTINCQVLSLAFSLSPSNSIIKIGVDA